MGRVIVACLVAGASALAAAEASAQTLQPGRYKSQPLNLHREHLGSEGLGEIARARVKHGDCTGAIDIFDAAIRTSTDPGLRRDRGLCHESQGHAYPAIDDYRAYLTATPEAADADGIRARLVKLEQVTLGYSSASSDAPGDVDDGAHMAGAGASSVVSTGTGASGSAGGAQKADYVDREDDPLQTPLRRGKGWSVAPFFSEHKWGLLASTSSGASSSFGDSGTWAECVGVQVRYSLSPSGALFAEAGYEHFNSTAVDAAVISGLTSQLGYELRFPIDPDYLNQLLVAFGVGYEHLSVAPNTAQISSISLGAFVPRFRFGWRHLVTSSAAVEVSLDGGVANFFRYADFPFNGHGATTYLAALNVSLIWGL